MKEKITIDRMREATPTQYKKFKGVSRQLVNNWLYRDKKLAYRTIPDYHLVLIQIPENELIEFREWVLDKE